MRCSFFRNFLPGLLILLVIAGCEDRPSEAVAPATTVEPVTWENAETRILFVGNSLTSSNNLPGLVEMIAQEAGVSVSTRSVTHGNFSLEDHWHNGIADAIDAAKPDLVVMQQGPSSLPQNQVHLKKWATELNAAVREAGAEPALFMVWPSLARLFAFPDVQKSYRDAAVAVDGRFFPAGAAIRRAHENYRLGPYGADGFHPSRLGSVIAALTIVRSLKPDLLADLPGEIESTSPNVPSMALHEKKETVFGIVEAVVEQYGF